MINKINIILNKNESGGVLITLIIAMVLISTLTVAVLSNNSTGLMNIVTFNSNKNAYYLAEAGMRYAASIYKYTENIDEDDINADDDKRKVLQNEIEGCVYNLPQNRGKFSLSADTYWFYSENNYNDGANVQLHFGAGVPENFEIPATGRLYSYDENGENGGFFSYSSGSVVGNVFSCRISGKNIYKDDMIYLVFSPDHDQNVQAGNNIVLKMTSINPDKSCVPLKNGFFEIMDGTGESDTRFFYKTAEISENGAELTLKNIFTLNNAAFDDFEISNDSRLVFKKNIILKSVGKIGTETLGSTRKITYSIPITDSAKEATLETITFNNIKSLQDNFTPLNGEGMEVKSYGTAGGNSLFANMISISADADGKKLGTFALAKKDTINSFWNDNNNLLNYDVQVKLSNGNNLLYGGEGISFRLRQNTNGYDCFGISLMKFYLSSVELNNVDVDNLAGKTVWGASKHGNDFSCDGSTAVVIGNATSKHILLSNLTFPSNPNLDKNDYLVLKSGSTKIEVGKINYPDYWIINTGVEYDDLIPEGIKPILGHDCVGSSNEWDEKWKSWQDTPYERVNNLNDHSLDRLVMVLWQQTDGTSRRWLAYKDITHDEYMMGCQASYDGRIVHDNTSLLLRLREDYADNDVKINKINVFYGEMSDLENSRTPDIIPFDILNFRKRYAYGEPSVDSTWIPQWPPEKLSRWTSDKDYFSHLQVGEEDPSGMDPQWFQWDVLNQDLVDSNAFDIFELADDGTITISALTTPDSGSYQEHEIGLHAFGNIGNIGGHRLAQFNDFALQLKSPGHSAGGFLAGIQQ